MVAALVVNASEHLSFKGIPLEGSVYSFCQKLKAKGFMMVESDANVQVLSGPFTGNHAIVCVVSAENSDDVFSVVVLLDDSDRWDTLVETYNYYKDLYTEKYEKPSQCVETIPEYLMGSNSMLMYALKEGTIKYECVFNAPGGTIKISIGTNGDNTGNIVIIYLDTLNISSKRQSDLDDI